MWWEETEPAVAAVFCDLISTKNIHIACTHTLISKFLYHYAGADWVIAVVCVLVLIAILFLTLLLGAVLTYYVVKRNRNPHNQHPENPVLVNDNQHNNDGVGNNPVPPLQGNGVNIPPEVCVPDNQEENNDAGDLPVPPVQGNDANIPPEVIVNGSHLDSDDGGDLPGPLVQGDDDANVPPEVGAGVNQQGNNDVIVNGTRPDDDDAGDHAPANYVPVPHELLGNGIGDLPSEVVDRHNEHDANFRLGVPIAVSNPPHERARFVGNWNTEANSWSMNEDMSDHTTEESIFTSEEEQNRQSPKQSIPEEKEQVPEECTDRNKQCRPVDAMQRKASTRSRGESIGWPSFSSPSRATSETNHSLVRLLIYRSCLTSNFMDCIISTVYLSLACIDMACLYLHTGDEDRLCTDIQGRWSECAKAFQLCS